MFDGLHNNAAGRHLEFILKWFQLAAPRCGMGESTSGEIRDSASRNQILRRYRRIEASLSDKRLTISALDRRTFGSLRYGTLIDDALHIVTRYLNVIAA